MSLKGVNERTRILVGHTDTCGTCWAPTEYLDTYGTHRLCMSLLIKYVNAYPYIASVVVFSYFFGIHMLMPSHMHLEIVGDFSTGLV